MLSGCGGSDDPAAQNGGNAGSGGTVDGGGSGGDVGTGGTGLSPGGGQAGSENTGGTSSPGGAAGEGGEGGDGDPEIMGVYVDCEDGDDAGSGSRSSPLKTLAHATQGRASGDTIWILDGVCDGTTQVEFNTMDASIVVPDGVSLRAETPGAVTFNGTYISAGIELEGSSTVSGIHFEQFHGAISAASGTIAIEGTSFVDVTQHAPIRVSGTADATISPGELDSYIGPNQHLLAAVEGQAKLTVSGGALVGDGQGSNTLALFDAAGESQLVLDGVTVQSRMETTLWAGDTADVTMDGCTVLDSGNAVVLAGSAHLALLDSNIEGTVGSGIQFVAGTPELEMIGSSIVDSTAAALLIPDQGGYPLIYMQASTLSGNDGGIDAWLGTTIEIVDSQIVDNDADTAARGINFTLNQVNHLKMRGTTVSGHPLTGIEMVANVGSTLDLGRGDDLGGNTIAGNNTRALSNHGNLMLLIQGGTTVYAAGNTWDPGVQGAASLGSVDPPPGQFAVTSNNVHELSGLNLGQNFYMYGSVDDYSTLRLAEDACVPTNTCP
ncbi:MAG TPA: right-handed parallel beta-helix repeat-containing protein [Polyangiaceae bacterium]|nr:right-handed parallel beta-helix repeat-containing protein [Polyangiaceae bacterium]